MDHSIDTILACVIVRNEIDRLVGLLEHHRRLGVERFFFVDNGSDDGTVEFLLGQPDVHLWRSSTSFRDADYGARWFEEILRRHACGNWVVIVDADELLWFDRCEERPLADLCAELDRDGHRAMRGVLLDLYPDGPLAGTRLPSDRSPLEVARWFDRRWHHSVASNAGPDQDELGVFGGVRRRLFGGDSWDYCLSKVPLLRFDTDTTLVGGQHWSRLPSAPERAAVLHFKLDARLVDLAWTELERGQRATHAQEYLAYAETLALDPHLQAFDAHESVEFTGSTVLRELGIVGPIDDPDASRVHADALLRQAEVRIQAGETARASALLARAAEVRPTAVAPVLRLAALHLSTGDVDGADAAFAEAIARQPDQLGIIDLALEASTPRPSWADAVDSLIDGIDTDLRVETDVAGSFTRTPDLGIARPVHDTAWIGFVDAVRDPTDAVVPFARRSLPSLWSAPEFQRSLPTCRALFTFAESSATWMRERTDVPVHVVPHPVPVSTIAFDPDGHRSGPDVTVIQPGVWLTRLNSICDLPLRHAPARGIRRIRCAPVGLGPLARALARKQRAGAATPSPAALRATVDRGPIDIATLGEYLGSAIVLADLIDACADPVLLACIGTATPVLVPPLPAVIEHVGADYPLLFESLGHAAELATGVDAVIAAHERLLEVRQRHAPDRFLAAVSRTMTAVTAA